MSTTGFKLCGDGELFPQDLPCPPPYSGGPFPYVNPFAPAPPSLPDGNNGGFSLSAGAVAGVVVLVVLVFSLACLFVYKIAARSRENRVRNRNDMSGNRNSGVRMTAHNSRSTDGLDDLLVKMLPVCQYHEESPVLKSKECAVCLSSFEEKELIRILPRCQHTFHLPCIDKWFESHANCPLCRETITLQSIETPELQPQNTPSVVVSIPDDSELVGDVSQEQSNSQANPTTLSSETGTTLRINDNDQGEQDQQITKQGIRATSCDLADAIRTDGLGAASSNNGHAVTMNKLGETGCADTWKFQKNNTSETASLRKSFSTGSIKMVNNAGTQDIIDHDEEQYWEKNCTAAMIAKLGRSPLPIRLGGRIISSVRG